jgi:mRNA capping enzyme, beta chain
MKDGVKSAPHVPPAANGHASINGNVNHAPVMQAVPATAITPIEPSDWEPSIMGNTPYEELTRYICDMIYNTIGNAEPPTDGAVFEIEAKLGEIHNIEEGRRVRLPVMTETIFDKTQFGAPTRFESSMNVVSYTPPPPRSLPSPPPTTPLCCSTSPLPIPFIHTLD